MADRKYESKWRTFSPQATVWVQNPLDHDVVYKVADEYNQQFEYVIPRGKVAELPGGKIAELGLKRIVDEIIQNSKEHARMYQKEYRSQVEDEVILRVKEAPAPKAGVVNTGPIDLSSGDINAEAEKPVKEEEEEKPNPAFTNPPKANTDKRSSTSKSKKPTAAAQAALAGLPDDAEVKGDE